MGRLIDASVLLDKHAEQCGEKSCDTCRFIGKEKCASYMAITETPTAYNVEEVVKELQETNDALCFHILCCKERNCEICVVNNFLSEQIEIVRKGGAK